MREEIRLSEIQILPVKPQNGLVAFASFCLNEQFYVGNIAIYTTPDGYGYRLVYPDKMLPNGKRVSLFHPIIKEAGEAINLVITEKYKELIMDLEIKKDIFEN
ncbi:MAG: septation protein SpoVG family protein [Candidatus Saganbacteria bacterium]|nr:septation protein SpoVG family protein [Candidatus Saganbacteria bacterium]